MTVLASLPTDPPLVAAATAAVRMPPRRQVFLPLRGPVLVALEPRGCPGLTGWDEA